MLHLTLERQIIVDPHASNDGTDRCAEEQHFLVLLIEHVVEAHIGLDLLRDIITGGQIPDE